MANSVNEQRANKRLLGAKMALLNTYPFYALLLTHITFVPDSTCRQIACRNDSIRYNPEFIDTLTEEELNFVLMHQVLHLALGHPFRTQVGYDLKKYDLACDIVVNSNIFNSMNYYDDQFEITFPHLGTPPNRAPDGQAGYCLDVDQVYRQLMQLPADASPQLTVKGPECDEEDSLAGASDEPSSDTQESNRQQRSDDEQDDGDGEDNGKGSSKDSGGDNDEENEEAELQELIRSIKQKTAERAETLKQVKPPPKPRPTPQFDDHTYWDGENENELIPPSAKWLSRCLNAGEALSSALRSWGQFPAGVKRRIDSIKTPLLDWRTILNDFVQEEITDYSFSPPDKRLQECPFFLPDFNEVSDMVKNVLFMIDTSASMDEEAVTQCYSEIYHAILQFNGRLQGMLGFFDSEVSKPVPFADLEEFQIITPRGGGGTSFQAVFDYVRTNMTDEPPASMIILSDGECDYPPESAAQGIPVLWVIDNLDYTPPWGKVARLIKT
ncbi:MAG: hypothetical protein IKB04_04965 [Clostridia bacterium]|nr:hypothetical protein [Clostridia bacterium]